jgi:hypothetical protein
MGYGTRALNLLSDFFEKKLLSMDDDAEMYIFMLSLVLVTISEEKESENLFLKNSMKSNLQHCNIWELHSDSLNN